MAATEREQEQSGLSVRAYCWGHSLGEYTCAAGAVSFALVESKPVKAEPGMLELVLGEGERFRIPAQSRCLDWCCGSCERAGVSVDGALRHAAGFDGLHGLVTSAMELDALAGHPFVFSNRKRDRVKVLY